MMYFLFVFLMIIVLFSHENLVFALFLMKSKQSFTRLYKLTNNFQYEDLKFTILGGGAFSLALAKVLCDKKIQTTLLLRNQTIADSINRDHYHPKYLSDCKLPESLYATSNTLEAFQNVNYIVHAVPMQASREFLLNIKSNLPVNVPILSVTKGVEIGTFSLMNDILLDTLGSDRPYAFLSGPSFAKEIMLGKPTAVVIASNDDSLASELSEVMSSGKFRCHYTRDVLGVELGGAVKNVIALAAGMCEGLDLGMNSMSSLVTRGCLEMGRVGVLFGADLETFSGLAGVGDTFGTCLGPLSRNRQVGFRLARNEKLEDVLKSVDGVSEGVYTALALHQLIKTKVKPQLIDFKFPIISGVANILQGHMSPEYGMMRLMEYPVRDENRGSKWIQ